MRSTERATHLINQLLSLARTENLRDAALKSSTWRALTRTWSSTVPQALERHIDFGVEQDEPAPIVGHAAAAARDDRQPDRQRAALHAGARRRSPRGPALEAPTVVLEIEDTGPGIPRRNGNGLRTLLSRAGQHVDGSGLGLAIVREIVEQHGASVAINDGIRWPYRPRPGPDARFRVRFTPVVAADLAEPSQPGPAVAWARVEDNSHPSPQIAGLPLAD